MGLFGSKGANGQARVLSLELKSWRQTERRGQVYALSLEVTVAGQVPFQADVTGTIPYDRVPRVGQVLPVTVAAADNTDVVIDWKRAPSITDLAQAASAAALAGDSAGAAAALGFTVRPQPDAADGENEASEGSGPA